MSSDSAGVGLACRRAGFLRGGLLRGNLLFDLRNEASIVAGGFQVSEVVLDRAGTNAGDTIEEGCEHLPPDAIILAQETLAQR